jgi:hypothetical protein
MFRVSREVVSESPGVRSETAGTSRTSSKVRPSSANFSVKASDADKAGLPAAT